MNSKNKSRIDEIVNDITSEGEYKGRIFDEKTGYFPGPRPSDIIMPLNLSKNEAVIGLKENISKMAQRYMLLVENSNKGWVVKKRLRTFEG